VNYHCPTCSRKKDVRAKCRLDAELKAKKEAELRVRAMMEKEKEERGQADEMAGAVFEFFASLLPQVMQDMGHPFDSDARPDLPETLIPSPDSITVTTVFGVHEEPSNVTVISASGPPPSYATYEFVEQEDEDIEELTEHLEDVAIGATATNNNGVLVDMGSQNVDDTGDDGDIDTDDFDAESALIDEFIDDGALTPTTGTTASNS
jgi:hypothetical protein